jgi:hypothetical protein
VLFCLAAAIAVAVVVVVAAAVGTVVATAAEEDQKDDDPAHIAAEEVVVAAVTHKNTSKNLMRFVAAHSMVFLTANYVLVLAFSTDAALSALRAEIKAITVVNMVRNSCPERLPPRASTQNTQLIDNVTIDLMLKSFAIRSFIVPP